MGGCADRDWLATVYYGVYEICQSTKSKGRQGTSGERYISKLLQKLPERYRVLNDLLLKYEGYTVQIDHVIVSEYGVFVIETRNFRGTIYGSAEIKRWVQINKGKKRLFYNPTIQNNRHRYQWTIAQNKSLSLLKRQGFLYSVSR